MASRFVAVSSAVAASSADGAPFAVAFSRRRADTAVKLRQMGAGGCDDEMR